MRFALDIGGTLIKCALVTDDGKIIRDGKFPADPGLSMPDFGKLIVDGSEKFIAGDSEGIELIGAGMAGFTDGARGIVFKSPNIPNVHDFQLSKILGDYFGIPAYAENDATAAAWGEYLFGAHDSENMMVVTLGTGIGGGLVLEGRLHRGEHGFSGEIGQMVLYPDGPECTGGGAGCLEHWTGRRSVESAYREHTGINEAVEPEVINERASNGESAAKQTWIDYGANLGIVFASCANLLDLDTIVLTGGLAGAWDNFYPALADSMKKYLITPLKDTVKIRRSNLRGNAGILGAAFLDKTR